jgi:hypothetical protein
VQGVNGEKQVTVELDSEARRALEEMLRRDTEEQEERERRRQRWSPAQPVETSCRVSRLVRAAIRRWAGRSCPPRAHRPFWTDEDEWQRRTLACEEYERQKAEDPDDGWFLVPPRSRYRILGTNARISLWLDAECLTVVERDAGLYHRGNRSEAIRAMIVAARPRRLAGTAGPLRGEWADARRRPTRRYPRFCDTAPEDDPWHDPWNED